MSFYPRIPNDNTICKNHQQNTTFVFDRNPWRPVKRFSLPGGYVMPQGYCIGTIRNMDMHNDSPVDGNQNISLKISGKVNIKWRLWF